MRPVIIAAHPTTTVTYTYWRLYITSLLSGTQPSVTEWGLSTTFDGSNILTGGTATAESRVNAFNDAANAFDGSTSTNWMALSGHVPSWIAYQITTGITEAKEISLYRNSSAAGITSFTVQKSSDGINYTDVITINRSWTITNRTNKVRVDGILGLDSFGQMTTGNLTFTNGQLRVSTTSGSSSAGAGVLVSKTGKRVWEVTINVRGSNNSGLGCGVTLLNTANAAPPTTTFNGQASTSWIYRRNPATTSDAAAGQIINSNSPSNYGNALLTGDVIGVVWDEPNGTLSFYRNGTSLGVAFASGVTGNLVPFVALYTSGDDISINLTGPLTYAANYPSDAVVYDS